jgi:predicted DNA binding protein
MSIIAEFDATHPGLTMYEALHQVPEMELELIQQVATDPKNPLLFVWAMGANFEAFEAALDEDPTVGEVLQFSEHENQVLYRIQATDRAEVVIYPIWVDLGADLLESRWRNGWWHDRMRFPDRETFKELRDWFGELGIKFELRGVYTDTEYRQNTAGLTPEQREALVVAYDNGFFDVPRESTMHDIAESIGISDQAVSERLRRAHARLVEAALR